MTAGENPALPRLPPRSPESHKGDFGHVLLIGGSPGMTGAISLSGSAALRSGAGLVTLAVPTSCRQSVAAFEPSYMTFALPEDSSGRLAGGARRQLEPLLEKCTAIGCGPGLGQSDDIADFVLWLFMNARQPLVLDADALNVLARNVSKLRRPAGPRVLTPHPGEMARLLGEKPASREEFEAQAIAFAQRTNTIVLLKGHRTLITDGAEKRINTTGNPGMATGGMGDILTGMVAALLAQNLSPLDAAQLAAHIHGLAGDLAAAELGQMSLIASDMPHYLPRAFQSVS